VFKKCLDALYKALVLWPRALRGPSGARVPDLQDEVSGTFNRKMALAYLCNAVRRADASGLVVGVFLVQVNSLKEVNDELGYQAGDHVLATIAQRLKAGLRDTDAVFRWSGNQFVAICDDIPERRNVRLVADKIKHALVKSISLAQQECFVSVNVGIAIYPGPVQRDEELLRQAEIALAAARSWGGNVSRVFTSASGAKETDRLYLKSTLRGALRNKQFVLEYQPQVDLRTGNISGVEALIRWRHPSKGLVGPARFIPLAEEIGVIGPIGEWVLRSACLQNKAWADAGLPALRTAVNLSARQFQDTRLVEKIMSIVDETGIDRHNLELEITEGILIRDFPRFRDALLSLRSEGVRVAIDDFGTGYSSLNYLAELPATALKLDGSFAKGLATPGRAVPTSVVAKSIVSLAHCLDMEVTAECVESKDIAGELVEMGCDQAQGHFFSKAVSAQQVATMLAKQASNRATPSLSSWKFGLSPEVSTA